MRVLVVSVVVHAAAYALMMRVPRRERPAEPPPMLPIEIVEDEPPARPTPALERSSEPSSEGASTRLAARGMTRTPRGEAPSEGGEAAARVGEATASEEPAPAWSGSIVSLSPKELGIGRDNPFLPRSEPAPPASNKPDLGLRFGPSSEGPALGVLRDVTSRSLAPLDGRARFTVRVDGKGDILGIDLDDATGGPGWDDARRMALEEMKAKKIYVPHGARGLNVRFEIVSELTYPTGQKTAGQFGLRDTGNPIPAVVLPDESNIGQRPTRKVHAHHLGTEVL